MVRLIAESVGVTFAGGSDSASPLPTSDNPEHVTADTMAAMASQLGATERAYVAPNLGLQIGPADDG